MSAYRTVLFVLSLLVPFCVLCATERPTPLLHASHRVLSQLDATVSERTLLQRGARAETSASTGGAGRCSWNADDSACEVGLAASAEHLSNSDNEFGQFVAQFAECAAVEDEESCRELEFCLWSDVHDGCLFVNFAEGHEDSPCVVDAPLSIAGIEAITICAEHSSQLPCVQDPICKWSPEFLHCSPSPYQIFTGLSTDTVSELTTPVVEHKVAQIMEPFQSEFETSDPDFDWTTVIGWEAPETDCPDWSDELICSTADGVMQNISIALYCNGRYSDPAQNKTCSEDPLCAFSMEAMTCGPSPETRVLDALNGFSSLTSSIGTPVDREVFDQVFDCQRNLDEDSCTGKCYWSTDLELCRVGFEWFARKIAKPGSDGRDPICLYLEAFADSGCTDHPDLRLCRRNPDCHELGGTYCVPTPEYLVETVLVQDSDLEASYSLLQDDCSSFESRRACLDA